MEFFKLQENKNKTLEIRNLFLKTFSDSEGDIQGKLIENLVLDFLTKTDSQNLNTFIAVNRNKIIGCIFFSKLWFEKSLKNSFLLAPVAIHTDYHGRGIGQNLIKFGHDYLKKIGVEQVFTYGDINFYSKVGYKPISDKIKAPRTLTYPEAWLAQSLTDEEIQSVSGSSYCVEEINNPEYW